MQVTVDEYRWSLDISAKGYPFYAIICAAFRQADTDNLERLKRVFPDTFASFMERYNAPLGVLPSIDGFTAQEWAERTFGDR